tara:strand:- start:6965 stop:10264 length:3300 start_codon:yes stop_codon:yes gene_type:complete
MAQKKTKKASNSYWMKFGGSNSSNLPAYRRYETGGNPSKDETSKIVNDPTFKTWFAQNARRSDVMQSSSNPQQLKSLFLNDINFPGNEMPLFSGEIDDYGNVDKSKRNLGLSLDMINRETSTEPAEKLKFFDLKKFGGSNLPKYNKGGYATGGGNRSDYSGVNDRNTNMGTSMQGLGDSNMLQYLDYVVPGLGTGLDFLVDLWGFKGEQKQYRDNLSDANTSAGTLDVIDRPSANKGTLDLSTRKDALAAQVNFTQQEPTFGNYMAPKMLQTAGAGLGRYAGGKMGSLGGGGGGGGEVGDVIDYDALGGGTHAKYGGMPKAESGIHIKPKNRGKFTDWASNHNMSVSEAANKVMGNTDGYSSDVVKMANFAKNAAGWNKAAYGGEMEFESGMDLRNLSKAAFGRGGGALQLGPGSLLQSGLGAMSGARNPYTANAMMMSSGMAGEQALGDGGPAPAQYEAEGGEVIMHEPGNAPASTGEIDALEGNSMLSKLEGSSHDDGGEVVDGEGEQYVFSNKLKSDKWGNISFSDAAEKIAKNISKYEEKVTEGDDITKSTAESMIQAWQQKLVELREEQETKRQEKFIEMVNSGAGKEELMQNFPDLTEQMMAEEAMASQQEEQQMPQDNPMGNIDMSELSAEDQQLIGARYGLPHKNHGGPHDDFDPYDFNTYTTDNVDFFKTALMGDEDLNLSLGKDYKPNKKDLTSILTENFEEDGALFKGDTYTDAGLLSDAILADYDSMRSAHVKEATGLTRKPKRGDYRTTTEDKETGTTTTTLDKIKYDQDAAAWKMYNSGLGMNWSENYGADAGISERKYYKTFYNDLIAKGTDPELAKTLTEKEKITKAKLDAANIELAEKKVELTDEEKAALLIQERQSWQKNKKLLGDIGNTMVDMAPTMYNFMKGNEDAEVEQFQGNKNDEEVEQILRGLTKRDISQELETNEETFNNLKYLARDASDGSSANAMNTLLRGMKFKQDADAAVYAAENESNQQNKTILAEFLNKSGAADRDEEIRIAGINSENRAAVEAFKAKGWEGLSGSNQLRQQIQNQINRDDTLKGLLDDIYPDVHKYKTETGGIDLEGLIEAHPELEEQLREYFKKAK